MRLLGYLNTQLNSSCLQIQDGGDSAHSLAIGRDISITCNPVLIVSPLPLLLLAAVYDMQKAASTHGFRYVRTKPSVF